MLDSNKTQTYIHLKDRYGAHNYHPLYDGCTWLKLFCFLSGYSSVIYGHPKISSKPT